MGNSMQKNYCISPNMKDLQEKIEQLIKENEKLKKNIQNLESKKANETIILKNNNLNIIDEQLQISIKKLVDDLLSNENINLDILPDYVERKIYENVFTVAIGLLKETLEKTKITILNQDITFNLHPS